MTVNDSTSPHAGALLLVDDSFLAIGRTYRAATGQMLRFPTALHIRQLSTFKPFVKIPITALALTIE
jgi:hypothetical protein